MGYDLARKYRSPLLTSIKYVELVARIMANRER